MTRKKNPEFTFPPRLPVEPFARWLDEYALVTEQENGEISVALDVVPRLIQRYRYRDQKQVAFDVVDRALRNTNRILMVDDRMIYDIEDLYPELVQAEAA